MSADSVGDVFDELWGLCMARHDAYIAQAPSRMPWHSAARYQNADGVVSQLPDGPIALDTFSRSVGRIRSLHRLRSLHRHQSVLGRILRLCIKPRPEGSQRCYKNTMRSLNGGIVAVALRLRVTAAHGHPLPGRKEPWRQGAWLCRYQAIAIKLLVHRLRKREYKYGYLC